MLRQRGQGRLLTAVVLVLGIATTTTWAIIEAPLPLSAILNDCEFIAVSKVAEIDAVKPLVRLSLTEDLKGKATFRKLAVHFKGDEDAKKLDHVPQLLKRVAPEMPVVLFVIPRGKNYNAFVYTNGTWFQILGQTGGEQVSWSLMHGEPFLRRTFKGTTAEMRQLVIDGLAGKAKLPKYDKKEPPGFGPEAPAKDKSTGASAGGGPLFGVIPTLGVGAPLLVLAALFPAVFGGVLLLFRQWIAFITVFSVNSMLLLLQYLLNLYWPSVLRDSWFGTDAGLWFVMTLVALVATVWAWQRQLARNVQGDGAADVPRKTELTVLWAVFAAFLIACVITVLWARWQSNRYNPRTDVAFVSIAIMTVGVFVAALYRMARELVGSQTALATEGVMIATILVGQVGYLGYRWGGEDASSAAQVAQVNPGKAVEGLHAPSAPKIQWSFTPANFSGGFWTSPFVHGDEIWVGAAKTSFSQGTLYCIDRGSGAKRWEFIGDNGDLKQMISSPVIVDNRLYIGEGFHNDPRCRLFCLDVKERKQLWTFQTGSQTEPTPCVAGGKVYFGAGNDGIYCVNANTGGEPIWQFPPKGYQGRLLRCGSSPVVVGNRLYAGSAVDRNEKKDPGETAIFCLDADSGSLHWKKDVPLPSWAGPVVSDGHVFFALGNGDILSDANELDPPAQPAGRMVSVHMLTGAEDWHFDVPNGILDKPAVDGQHVYFGCRDGNVYCVSRHDGKLRWKTQMDSPIIASPVLARCTGYAQTAHVFAVATGGKVACLNPTTGDAHWTLPLTDKEGLFSATPTITVARVEGGDRRVLYVAGGLGELPGRPVLFCIEDFVKVE